MSPETSMPTSWSSTRPSTRSYTQVRAIPSTNRGWGRDWFKSSPEGKDARLLVDKKQKQNPQHEPEIYVCSPESQPCPGLLQKQHDQQVEGGYHPPLLCAGVMWSGVPHSALKLPAPEAQGPIGASPEEGHLSDNKNTVLFQNLEVHKVIQQKQFYSYGLLCPHSFLSINKPRYQPLYFQISMHGDSKLAFFP